MAKIRDHRDLRVFQSARDAAMQIYEISRGFPRDEERALTSQIRRSSRAVCANLAEGFQRRGYPASFAAKLVDAAAEADETRVWIDFALRCGFVTAQVAEELEQRYDRILGALVLMKANAKAWGIR